MVHRYSEIELVQMRPQVLNVFRFQLRVFDPIICCRGRQIDTPSDTDTYVSISHLQVMFPTTLVPSLAIQPLNESAGLQIEVFL